MRGERADWSVLGRAVGGPVSDIESALGGPEVRRDIGGDGWLVFAAPIGRLRVRCQGTTPEATVSSWSLTLEPGFSTLREACEPFGLWPAGAPDEPVAEFRGRLIRRAITGSSPEASLTLTATIRAGRIRKLDLFDEEPDWI